MRNLATIQTISAIESIQNADTIEKVTILGWHCVAKKGEFKVGDKCVYFEIDSLLPKLPQFEFLANKGTKKMLVDGQEVEGYRLRTIRLRGQISQGLALPLSAFTNYSQFNNNTVVGTDVSNAIGVLKYEAPVPVQLSGKIRGVFPSFIPKTDETRLQSVPQILERYKETKFYITEKLDGSSVTMFWRKNKDVEGEPNEFHVCSRNLDLLDEPSNTMWRVVRDAGIPNKMLEMPEGTVLQGELIGEGIQKNPLKINGQKILIFNAYNYLESRYLDLHEFIAITGGLGIETVPLVAADVNLYDEVDKMVYLATKKSILNPNSWAEGFVFRPMTEMRDEDLGRLSFKVINPEYLLAGGE